MSSRFTRREMLETSLLSAAAAATAGGVPQTALAWEGSKNASEKLRSVVIGVRSRGKSHIGSCLSHNVEIAYIADADESIGQKACDDIEKKTGKRPTFVQDMRKAFDDDTVDFASIATPNHWHALAAIWAIQSGKDVYVEKPVSHNVSEGRRIVQFARKYNKIVQTGTQCRSMGGTIEAIEFIKSGGIGDVKIARGLCFKPRGSIGAKGNYDVPASVEFDVWTGPAPMKELARPRLHYDWHWVWDTGNGDLGNQGIHQMDIARWGLDVEGLGQGVISYGGRLGYEDAGETANSQVSIHDYGDKKLIFETRGLKTGAYMGSKIGVIFHGTEGYVSLSSYTGGVAVDKDNKIFKKFNAGGDHYGNFLAAVESRKHTDLNADIEQGHLSSALCHLGNVSLRTGAQLTAKEIQDRLGSVKERQETFERFSAHLAFNKLDLESTKFGLGLALELDGQKEVFTGTHADIATPWLTREYRKPYIVPTADQV